MRVLLVSLLLLPLYAWAEGDAEPVLRDIDIGFNLKSFEKSLVARQQKDEEMAEPSPTETEYLDACKMLFMAAYGQRDADSHSDLSDDLIEALGPTAPTAIVIVPQTSSDGGPRSLIGFSRWHSGYGHRLVLYSDGNTDEISASQFRKALSEALNQAVFSLDFSADVTGLEEQVMLQDVELLADDDLDTRMAATRRLRQKGMQALPVLSLGANSTEPERRERCLELLEQLKRLVSVRDYINEIRHELDLKPLSEMPEIPAAIELRDGKAIVGPREFSLTLLQKEYPDIYAGLRCAWLHAFDRP